MKQIPSFVLVEDFDLEAITKAFKEGRLFIQRSETSESQNRQQAIADILKYVARIDDCTSTPYRSHIGELWSDILHDSTLGDLFFYTRYARNRGQINWYRVTAFVCLLREYNVYRKNDFTAVELHLRLENSPRRTNRYNGMSRYLLDRKDIVTLHKLLLAVKPEEKKNQQ